jgi:hypothetical protein
MRIAATLLMVTSCFVFSTTLAIAGDCPREGGCYRLSDDQMAGLTTLTVRVEGKLEDGKMQLSVEAGAVATHAISIFAQPSERLLLLAVDRDYRETPHGQERVAKAKSASAMAITTPARLAGARPTVVFELDPWEDTRIEVHVHGTWPDGTVEERLVSHAALASLDEFSFATYAEPSLGGDVHCCDGAQCSQFCFTCDGPYFCCHVTPGCCGVWNCGKQCDPC